MSADMGGPGTGRGLRGRGWLIPALAAAAGVALVLLVAGITALVLANRGGDGDGAAQATGTTAGSPVIIGGSASATGATGAARTAGTTGAAGTRTTAAPGATTATGATTTTGATVARTTTGVAAQTTAAPPPPASGANKVFVVSGTDNEGVRLRGTPGSSGNQIAVLPEGARLEQIGADRQADGVTWRNVRTPEGQEGWVAAQFTSEAP